MGQTIISFLLLMFFLVCIGLAANWFDWHRDTDNEVFLGVCAGLAKQYGFQPNVLRLGFVLTAFTGIGVMAYLVLWASMPEESKEED